jgi:glycyl-tRNA synthetase (class II)
MKIGKLNLPKPRTIWNIDGTHNKSGHIMHFVDLLVRCGDRSKEMRFLITDLGEDEIVLRVPLACGVSNQESIGRTLP